MTTVFKGLLQKLWQPCRPTIRLRTKINIQKPRPPHFTRAKVLEFCKPVYPRRIGPNTPLYELCQGPGISKVIQENPYEDFLAKQVLDHFNNHKYIMFYHRNSMRYYDLLQTQVMLKRCGVRTFSYGRSTLEKALTGTVYQPTLMLYQSHTLTGFGNEVDLKTMLKQLRRTKLNLLAGIIDGRFLNVTELQSFSELPDLASVRASFLSTLNTAAGKIVQQLNQHQRTLVQHLEQHAKSLQEGKT